jgi:hypothetical protein
MPEGRGLETAALPLKPERQPAANAIVIGPVAVGVDPAVVSGSIGGG